MHADDSAFGYPLIHDELTLTQGRMAGRNRVARLCREHQVVSVNVKRGVRSKIAGPVVHDYLVQRQFHAASLDQSWFTDITEHPTSEGKLYAGAIKDACSNRIVVLSMGPRMTSDLACNALRRAIAARSPACTIAHSDRGGQFRSRAFVTTLRTAGRKGPWAESPPQPTMPPWSPSLPCCPEPSPLRHPRATTPRDPDLDRTRLPAAPSTSRPRQNHPN